METAARQARAGVPAPDVDTGVLRAWSWQASASGTEGPLVSPATGAPAPAAEVVGELLAHVGPVLEDQGELAAVEDGTVAVLRGGTGARHQRAAWAARADPADVVRTALAATQLVRMVGAEVAAALFVVDLPDLGGADRLRKAQIAVSSLIAFEGE